VPRGDRRNFLKRASALALAGSVTLSLEERALLAQDPAAVKAPPAPLPRGEMPGGKIGSVVISRLICGGNLISGFAHSRDLTYVSALLRHYFTDAKIMDTWALCEAQGINTMVASSTDPHAAQVYRQYCERGGRIQYIAQINPSKEDLETCVKRAADAGAVGAFLLGNLADLWVREGRAGLIGELLGRVRDHQLIAGVAGHELSTIRAVEEAGLAPDFYVKTLHTKNYWSQQRPEQNKEVIDNYAVDNYWCRNPPETIAYLAAVKRPWIAYKVLAAGAIHPRDGFRHAFANGADFALVGMFDFQVAENVHLTRELLAGKLERPRPWCA
jgi:hypothetical protein